MKNKKRLFIAGGLTVMAILSVSAIIAANILTKEENLDTRSEAAIPEEGMPVPPKYGSVVKINRFTDSKDTLRSKRYRTVLDANYEWLVTPEGTFHSIHGESEEIYNWENIDPVLEWAEQNNKNLKYHALLWHNRIDDDADELLDWYDDLASDAERLAAIEEHTKNIIKHYKGKITMYDLVNHANDQEGDGNFMNTGKNIDEAIVLAFKWANEVDTTNTYVINSNTKPLYIQSNRDKYIKRINDANELLEEGEKIDAVGIMGHFGWCTGGEIPPIADIKTGLDQISTQTGLPIHITELDISHGSIESCGDEEEHIDPMKEFTAEDGTIYDNWYDYQKWAYGELFKVFHEDENVEVVFSWGFYDGVIWRDDAGFFDFNEDPDKDFEPKPAYSAVKPFYECKPSCTDKECDLDGCGGVCGTCTDPEVCNNDFQCVEDEPVEEQYPACNSLTVNGEAEAIVTSKTEEIKVKVTGVGKDDTVLNKIHIFAGAYDQENKKPEDFICTTVPTDPQYSYYCKFIKAWFEAGVESSSNEYTLTTNWNELVKVVDDGVANDGREYEGTLEERGIAITANVVGSSTSDVCSSNIALNSGDGAYYNDGKWDIACDGGCNATVKLEEPPGEPKCDDICTNNDDCPSDLVCSDGQCRNNDCKEEEDCTCAPDNEKPEDINGDNKVDLLDISLILTVWGQTPTSDTSEDVNKDGKIDLLDISAVLGKWD